jgi:all-trans-retinol 13,14-reductase
VVSLVAEDGVLQYASTNDGQQIYGKHFIAGIHPALLENLLDKKLLRPAFHNRIATLPQTKAAFCVNLVVRPGTVPAIAYNTYWHRTDNAFNGTLSDAEWPNTYAVYSTEDPLHPGFADTVSILTYIDYQRFSPWATTYNHTGHQAERGSDYQELKMQLTAELLAVVSRRFPIITANIIAQDAATPLTYRDYTGTPTGALYGILKDVTQPLATTIATRTRIPNLLLTGQNINMHGVLGVSITAVMTAGELLGLDHLLRKINK